MNTEERKLFIRNLRRRLTEQYDNTISNRWPDKEDGELIDAVLAEALEYARNKHGQSVDADSLSELFDAPVRTTPSSREEKRG